MLSDKVSLMGLLLCQLHFIFPNVSVHQSSCPSGYLDPKMARFGCKGVLQRMTEDLKRKEFALADQMEGVAPCFLPTCEILRSLAHRMGHVSKVHWKSWGRCIGVFRMEFKEDWSPNTTSVWHEFIVVSFR
jgi:hypothetical protein